MLYIHEKMFFIKNKYFLKKKLLEIWFVKEFKKTILDCFNDKSSCRFKQ